MPRPKKPDPTTKEGAIAVLRELLESNSTPPREKVNAVRALSDLKGFNDTVDWDHQSEKARFAAVREVIADVWLQITGDKVVFDDDESVDISTT